MFPQIVGIVVRNGCPLARLQVAHRNVRLWANCSVRGGWRHPKIVESLRCHIVEDDTVELAYQ